MVRVSCSALQSEASVPRFVQADLDSFMGRLQAVMMALQGHQQQLAKGKPTPLFLLPNDFNTSTLSVHLNLKITPQIDTEDTWILHELYCIFLSYLCGSRS